MQKVLMKDALCMEGGQGESSYIKNSQVQEILDKVQLPRRPGKHLLTAADLGCSCGHNTLIVADAIVEHMTSKLRSSSFEDQDDGDAADPEFCFYFCDLPSNDFNTFFHLLPQHATAAAGNGSGRRYFAAAVPGSSFHNRLFPRQSIDVFTSTFSLHWLSQVPEGVADNRSAAYNKDKVFVHGASQATGAAYRRQFQSDMARFLRCRAMELKPEGVMFLVCLGRPSQAGPTNQGRVQLLCGAMFEESRGDLVEEGTIGREMMDSFNVPVYDPTLEELREAVDVDGSFQINRLELVITSSLAVDDPKDRRAVGRTVANYVRSLLGPLVDAHVGRAVADEIFVRMRRRAEALAEELVDEMRFPHIVCSLSLDRVMKIRAYRLCYMRTTGCILRGSTFSALGGNVLFHYERAKMFGPTMQ
uniref:Putative jasmonate O-methyltransferase n=1 Tax=Oryza punctata TaxID=4537 RepID=G9C2V4_ORYPU|nr:putative jasmonate O-methyltransferase [Oryza punctata]